MKKEIKLSRIHCAGCAENLEQKVAEVDGVNSVHIDFLTRVVTIDIQPSHSKEIIKKVEDTITKFDSSIKIIDDSKLKKEEKREKIAKILDVCKIFIAICFAVSGYFIPENLFWLKLSFYIVSYIAVGFDVIIEALKHIIKGKLFDENFLMTIATIGAFILSEYIEAIAVMLFYSIGEFFEKLAVEKSKRRIRSLSKIKSDTANVIESGKENVIPVENVKVGDKIVIKPGERVPLDVMVVSGSSYINNQAITGESKEIFVKENDELLSGGINGEGLIIARVIREYKDSTVSKILDMVERATKNKAKTERFITKFSKWYTPIVVGLAVLLFLIPSLITGDYTSWLYRALVFLVVSCPCALVLSIPLGYFAGIGSCARQGIMIKGANYLEMLAKVEAVVFDKTGTLTKGDFKVVKIYASDESSEEEVLELISYGEFYSNHKIAKSIVKCYKKDVNTAWIEDYKEIPGKGIKARIFMEECLIGNEEFLRENNVDIPQIEEIYTVIYLAKSGKFLGYVAVGDELKKDSALAIGKLKDLGIKNISMLTGDNDLIAKSIAEEIKLDSYYSKLLPNGKVEKLKKLKEKYKTIAFVGDGINDAPVLASTDVGVSMGGMGSDAAVEASDVVLMTDEPSKLIDGLRIAKKTRKLVLENIMFTLGVKTIVLGLSAFGITGMWLAIFADIGVALIAVLNSMRAMIHKNKKTTQ